MTILYTRGDLAQYQIQHLRKYLTIQRPEEFEKFIFLKRKLMKNEPLGIDWSQTQISSIISTEGDPFIGTFWGSYYLDEKISLRETLKRPSFPNWMNLSTEKLKEIKKPLITILSDKMVYPKLKKFPDLTGFYYCLISFPNDKRAHKYYLSEEWLEPLTSNEYYQQHFFSLSENKTKKFIKDYLKKLKNQ